VDQSKTVGEDYAIFTVQQNPYLKFLRHKFHSEILADSPERGRQTRVGIEMSYFYSFMRRYLEKGTRLR